VLEAEREAVFLEDRHEARSFMGKKRGPGRVVGDDAYGAGGEAERGMRRSITSLQ
jgi:hypothetical protein